MTDLMVCRRKDRETPSNVVLPRSPSLSAHPKHHIFDMKQLCVHATAMLWTLERKTLTLDKTKIFN